MTQYLGSDIAVAQNIVLPFHAQVSKNATYDCLGAIEDWWIAYQSNCTNYIVIFISVLVVTNVQEHLLF